jgi:Abnormal spindle-like microcephaly-assoc'd, ASPM-SPD-2-Hydin
LTFSALTTPANFALDQSLGSSCKVGTAVAAGQTCSISVTFSPSSPGALSGNFTITSNAGSNVIALSGIGIASSTPTPTASLDATSLSFGAQVLGTRSVTQQVTLTNNGTKPLTIASISDSSGEFIRTGTCAAGQIAISASCTIVVEFQPTSLAAKNATITITDDAGNAAAATQTVNLSGTGITAAVTTPTASPVDFGGATALDFGNQSVNVSSAAQIVTISNTDPVAQLLISSISLAGANPTEYAIDSGAANACSASVPVAVSGSCVVSVSFTPTIAGAQAATLTVTTNAIGSPHSINMSGTGSATAGPAPSAGPATNVGGGGCATHSGGRFDPVLLTLLVLSLTGIFRPLRNKRRVKSALHPNHHMKDSKIRRSI